MANLFKLISFNKDIFGISKDSTKVTLEGMTDLGVQLKSTNGFASLFSANGNVSILAPNGNADISSKTRLTVDAPYTEIKNCMKLIPAPAASAVNNSLYIDSTSGLLKFKDINGVIKTINLS
ncbi:hypothetical protein [Peribacillus frigoritolerans]|uniref:hypothetical protein n=1 Tax=Peribacillus frigoritolerans TaxID=450367 RepID=UPI003306095F